ncbi:hypothetical protein [Staphylococcus equorum]|uniref:Uncharacterized protein n=1 Tax=Staphylococcus equorum TaxID=246432 RepID=A0AAP7IF11_9STAP|nr:hypothetical protein [Staphylococcus equorum]OEK58887.1 hypothetical protein ASS94_00770 [Staphylococcus equorum]
MKLSNLFKKKKTTSKSKNSNKTNKVKQDKNQNKKQEEEKKKKESSALKSKMSKEASKKKRPMLKSKRERRRAKENRDRNYDMVRGLFGDRDYRTKQGLVNAWLVVLAIACIAIGTQLTISGFSDRAEYLRTNTTPIGEELKFSNSETTLKFGGAWTDKDRDVTVVKLQYDKKAREELSTKGSQYKLHIVDNEDKVQDNVKMSYGILGTQGDGFLIIDGKLDKKAYNIVMTNQLDLSMGDDSTSSSSSSSRTQSEKLADNGEELTQAELEESLSGTQLGDVEENGRINFEENSEKPSVDFIDFNINSYSEKTKVINDSLRKPDGSVDYSKILDETTVNQMIKNIDNDIEVKTEETKQFKRSVEEFEDRVKENKDDEDAKSNIESLKKKIEDNEKSLKQLKKLKEQYKNEDFTKESFGDMQEKYKVIHMDE